MSCGILLISVKPGSELEVYENLLKLKMISEVLPVLGTVDFVVQIVADGPDDIAKIIINNIRTIKGVISTRTFIVDEFMVELETLYT